MCASPVIGWWPIQGEPHPGSWDKLQKTPETQEWRKQTRKMDGRCREFMLKWVPYNLYSMRYKMMVGQNVLFHCFYPGQIQSRHTSSSCVLTIVRLQLVDWWAVSGPWAWYSGDHLGFNSSHYNADPRQDVLWHFNIHLVVAPSRLQKSEDCRQLFHFYTNMSSCKNRLTPWVK